MSSPQKSYRVCCFDAVRNIVTADFIKASSDAEAIAAAEAMDFGTKCEIWDRNRLVASLDAVDPKFPKFAVTGRDSGDCPQPSCA